MGLILIVETLLASRPQLLCKRWEPLRIYLKALSAVRPWPAKNSQLTGSRKNEHRAGTGYPRGKPLLRFLKDNRSPALVKGFSR